MFTTEKVKQYYKTEYQAGLERATGNQEVADMLDDRAFELWMSMSEEEKAEIDVLDI